MEFGYIRYRHWGFGVPVEVAGFGADDAAGFAAGFAVAGLAVAGLATGTRVADLITSSLGHFVSVYFLPPDEIAS